MPIPAQSVSNREYFDQRHERKAALPNERKMKKIIYILRLEFNVMVGSSITH
ncbi:hypothetical protein KSP40_PGU011907 [Platanthera guangdongensis]|uniref:Ribosomal protein S14 n=1 Tax=Platanthera guangdongensis TaxID=2320717 RepID=A0ABR2MAV6_9ASPA